MIQRRNDGKRLFVLDTNVLMHDPTALFRFQEHDIFLPMVVIEELDNAKKGTSEVARSTRQASRFLDELINNVSDSTIADGIPLDAVTAFKNEDEPRGRLFLQNEALKSLLPDRLPGKKLDDSILATAHALQEKYSNLAVTLVSKDINLRIKAAMLDIHAEDYYNDKVLDDLDLLHSGVFELPADFWDTHAKDVESWKEDGRTFYKITGPIVREWYPNDYIYTTDGQHFEAVVRQLDKDVALIEMTRDYRSSNHAIWGISARNREQNFALNALMDPKIDLVTIQGNAGTGKTLLALAAALTQTLEQNLYREIVMTRATISVGEDIGFLPGTEEEKMTPWMGALMDNLEVLTQTDAGDDWGRNATQDLLRNRIRILSMNFMRGRTFLNKFIIIDEAQNLTAKQMQTLVTRAGPGTKIVCLGNLAQIDTAYLTETSSGLTSVVDRFKSWEHSAHITLMRGERSRLADYAAEQL